MYIRDYEGIGVVEVHGDLSIYGHGPRDEDDEPVFVFSKDLDPVHKATLESLMEDIRKPAVALRAYIQSLKPLENLG